MTSEPRRGVDLWRALTVRHIWQLLHGGALVVHRETRVLARNRGALVPYDLACEHLRKAFVRLV